MFESIDLALLGRYLDGTATKAERETVEAWIGDLPERRAAVAELRDAWAADAQRLDAPYDADAAWQRVRVVTTPRPSVAARWPRTARRGLAAAAVLAAVAAGPVWWFARDQATDGVASAEDVHEHTAPRGRREVVHLADGTVVTLNADSRLRVPADFGGRPWFGLGRRTRAVTLEGEAYFDVAHDERRPFIVRTERSTVRVLGTKFGVRAYGDAPVDRVALAEGVVAVMPAAGQGGRSGRMRPGQVVSVSGDGRLRLVRDADVDDELAWTRGWLVLENVSLGEAARRISRWYDLDVRIADRTLAQRPVTGSYRDEPVTEVLTLITAAIGARYEQEGRAVTIHPAN